MAKKVELLILNVEKCRKDEGLVVINTTCPECGKQHYLGMTVDDFRDYAVDCLVDKVFPDESADVRELLITGTCPECWDKLFPKEEQSYA